MSRLTGNKIILRELQIEDYPDILKWTNDPEITKFLSEIFYAPQTQKKTESFLNDIKDNKLDNPYFFIIADKKNNKYLGQINHIKINWVHRSAELAIVIGNKENHGKGIGKEAINLFLNFSFNQLNLNRVELKVHEYNTIGIQCYKSCGFIEEGRLRKSFYKDSKYSDYVLMSILKEEFNKSG